MDCRGNSETAIVRTSDPPFARFRVAEGPQTCPIAIQGERKGAFWPAEERSKALEHVAVTGPAADHVFAKETLRVTARGLTIRDRQNLLSEISGLGEISKFLPSPDKTTLPLPAFAQLRRRHAGKRGI